MKKIFIPGTVALVALFVLGSGTVQAQATLPNAGLPAEGLPKAGLTPESPFYFLDKFGETLRDFLTFNPEAKARLQVAYAAERIVEIKIILETRGVDTKGLEVARARLEANAAKAADIVKKEENKGKDVSKLAGEIVDSFHLQRKAVKQAFDDAKQEFSTKKKELHNQLLAAIETGDAALQEKIRAELVAIEAAKDEAEAKKDATIDILEAEKDRLQGELEEKKRQEDEARDVLEEAVEDLEEAKEKEEEFKEEQAEKEREAKEEQEEKIKEVAEKEAEQLEKEREKAEEAAQKAEEKLRELEEKENED